MNLFYLAYSWTSASDLCENLKPVLGLVGWLILGIKIAVPIILIVVGMIDMAKAVTSKSDDEIKKAQSSLIKKAIAAAVVFLVMTIVGLLMSLLNNSDWEDCQTCLNSPWSCQVNSK